MDGAVGGTEARGADAGTTEGEGATSRADGCTDGDVSRMWLPSAAAAASAAANGKSVAARAAVPLIG